MRRPVCLQIIRRRLAWLIAALAALPLVADGASFAEVRDAVFSDPYRVRPNFDVSLEQFGSGGDKPGNALRAAARRTLTSDADLIDFPHGRKLFQPNGICYAGRWSIDADNDYTGAFAPGIELAAIVRISVMLGAVRTGDKRTLGMGVKLFGRNGDTRSRSANLLVMDAIAGSRRRHTSMAVLDNNPDFGGLPALGQIRSALRIRADLDAIDGELSAAGPALRYRDLNTLAALDLVADEPVRAPHWIRLRVRTGTPAVDADDFRDELSLRHYPEQELHYRIETASFIAGGKNAAAWQHAGWLVLYADIVSASCDQRLHFAHPRLQR